MQTKSHTKPSRRQSLRVPKTVPRGRPDFADSQRRRILELLRQAGSEGVSRSDLIFKHRFTQCGTRIFELEKMSYKIRHEMKPGQHYVTYFLESEPEQETHLSTYQPRAADPRQCTFAEFS